MYYSSQVGFYLYFYSGACITAVFFSQITAFIVLLDCLEYVLRIIVVCTTDHSLQMSHSYRATAIEMVTSLAQSQHGRQYLAQQGIMDKISNMIVGADSDPFSSLYLPGLHAHLHLEYSKSAVLPA